ncbi:MAG: hypothetical protein OEM26_20915 [Saprospiraceae bacterium]|nr:hypothetical protein [Saprospiraceae bacterium]
MNQIKWIFALIGIFLITGVEAQTGTPGVNGRQISQHKRIKHGVKNGEITYGEFVGLQRQQRGINKMKKLSKSDGYVGPRERSNLHREQNRSSHNIFRKKHNNWKR